MTAQTSADFGIPDSAYVPDELLVWFKDGTLNLEYLGGYGDTEGYPFTDEGCEALPLNVSFIQSSPLVSYLQQRGVQAMYKVVPWLDPYRDTLSITRRGDTIGVAPLWNLLRLEFDPQAETDPVFEAYMLLAQYHDAIQWAQPNLLYRGGNETKPTPNFGESEFRKMAFANDYFFDSLQVSLWNTSEGIFVDNAWTYNTGNPDVRIAIIDDGIYPDNPDFAGKLPLNPKMIYGTGGPGDHGTDMAGIIGGLRNNIEGIAGIAGGDYPTNLGCPLYILDAYTQLIPAGHTFNTGDIARAVTDATLSTTGTPRGFGCHAINISLYGTYNDPVLLFSIASAYAHGISVNACMGNEASSTVQYPAGFDNHHIIAVGAKREDYRKHPTGSTGPHMDVMGPGESGHIFTTKTDTEWNNSGGETSAATAHSTGVSALLISEYLSSGSNVDKPYYAEDIENLLKAGCVDDQGHRSTQHSDQFGWGYINAENSLSFLHAPYVLRHYQQSFTVSQLPTAEPTLPRLAIFADVLSMLSPTPTVTTLNTQPYKITSSLSYPDHFSSVLRVWGRGVTIGTDQGYAPPRVLTTPTSTLTDPIVRLGYTGVSSFGPIACDVETYFYHGVNIYTNQSTWMPFDPLNQTITFNYSVLGIPQPASARDQQAILEGFRILSVYPNPILSRNTSHVRVDFQTPDSGGDTRIILKDCLGRTVREQTHTASGSTIGSAVLQVSDLPSGTYILSARSAVGYDSKILAIVR
jgi:subtilisin family serine protease